MPADGILQFDESQMRLTQQRFDQLFIFATQESGSTSNKLSSSKRTQKKFDSLFLLLSSTQSPRNPSRQSGLENEHAKAKSIVVKESAGGTEVASKDKVSVVINDQAPTSKVSSALGDIFQTKSPQSQEYEAIDSNLQQLSTVSSAMTLYGQGGIGGRFSRRIQGTASGKRLCPLCVSGSNKLFGHKGKHQTTLKRIYSKTNECSQCAPGSGKMECHIGRHITVAKRKHNVGEPCPHCSKESGKMAGHRGRHVTVRQFIYEEHQSNDETSQEVNSKETIPGDADENQFRGLDERETTEHLATSEKTLPKYERERLANIKRNDAYLASLGLKKKSMFRTKVSQAGSGPKKSKLTPNFPNLPPRILPKRRRVEPKYFKDEQARELNASRNLNDSDFSSEDLSSEMEDEDGMTRTDKDEEWHHDASDNSEDESWPSGSENVSSMQNERKVTGIVAGPKKRKRGRPKKGTGSGATTKEKILQSRASIVRVTKSTKINQFKQSYHNGTFSQMPGNGMNFLRRYNLISNSSQIPRTSFHNVREGTGLGKTKIFGPLMLPLGSSVKLYKYLTPKPDNSGRIMQQFQTTHLLVAKHKSFPLAKFLSTRKGLDGVIEKLRNSPRPDKIRTFECRTKLMCEICYAKFVNFRYLASHRTACAKRGGVWTGTVQTKGLRGQKAHVRYIYNDPKLNPRKVRRAKRVQEFRKQHTVSYTLNDAFRKRVPIQLGDGTTVVHVKQTKKPITYSDEIDRDDAGLSNNGENQYSSARINLVKPALNTDPPKVRKNESIYTQSSEVDEHHNRKPLSTPGSSSNIYRSNLSNNRNSDAFFSKLFSSSDQSKDLNMPAHDTHDGNDKSQSQEIVDRENKFGSWDTSMVMAPPLQTHDNLMDSLFE